MTLDLVIEILGFSVGLLYLWWEYHADVKLWFASLVMPCISMWIYFSKGLYADFAINIYYLLIAVYGFVSWTRGGKSSQGKPAARSISHIPLWATVVVVAVSGVLWLVIWWLLVSFTDSNVPVADAFTTALSIVGLWMMARKYAEQWWVWFVVDIVSCALYLYKGIPFYSILYGIYTIVCVFGYRKWIQLMRQGR